MLPPPTPVRPSNAIPNTEQFRSPLSDGEASRGWPTLFQYPGLSDLDQETLDRIYEGRNPDDHEELLQYHTVPQSEPTLEARQAMTPFPSPIQHYDPEPPRKTTQPVSLEASPVDFQPHATGQGTSPKFDVKMEEPIHDSQMDTPAAAPPMCFWGPGQQNINQGNQPFHTGHPIPTIQMRYYTPDIRQYQATYLVPHGVYNQPQPTQDTHQSCTKPAGPPKKPVGSHTKAEKARKSYEARKKWKCPYCPLKATCKYNMDQHLRTHTGEKPYDCRLCGRQYPRSWSVTRHLRSVHKFKHEELKRYFQEREQAMPITPPSEAQQLALPEFIPYSQSPVAVAMSAAPSVAMTAAPPDTMPAAPPIPMPAALPTSEPEHIPGIDKDDANTWPWIFMTRLPEQSTVFSCIECSIGNTFHSAVDLQFHRHVVHHAAVSPRCTCSICNHAFESQTQTGVAEPKLEPVHDDPSQSVAHQGVAHQGVAHQETAHHEIADHGIAHQRVADQDMSDFDLFATFLNQPYPDMLD